MKTLLVLLILNMSTGEILERHVIAVFNRHELCTKAQADYGIQRPLADGTLKHYRCVGEPDKNVTSPMYQAVLPR